MTFLNPLFLFGLAAGIIPILIHRLVQRHGKIKKFSAVRLLLLSQQNLVRPERIKELILLALRVLAVLCLALLLARPAWLLSGVFSSGREGARILILDNSMSMGFREDRGQRFETARNYGREILKDLNGKVIVLPTCRPPGITPQDGPPEWLSPEAALRELESLSLSFGKGNPAAALNAAFLAAKEAKSPVEVVILSDLVRAAWEGAHPGQLKNVPAMVNVTFVRFGGEKRDPNLAVREARLVRGQAVAGTPGRLDVAVANFSDRPASTPVQLFLNGAKSEQKSIDLPPGGEGSVAFDLHPDRAGAIQAEIRLAEDRLPADDRFYFPIEAREKIRVLIVDGDPRPAIKAGESYYVVNALSPGKGEGTPFHVQVVQEGELERADLKPFHALFLLNVSQPPLPPLASYLQTGKPLFIFLGNRVNPEAYRRLPFFPWQLREIRQGGVPVKIRPASAGEAPQAIKALWDDMGESLRKASFERYYKIARSGKTLFNLENGDPLLMEAEAGKGRVFLFASSADLDWNDLPLNAGYLPLIQAILKEGVGMSRSVVPTLRFGEAFPDGAPAQESGTPGGPGIYRFSAPSGEIRRGLNPPPEESDLRKMTGEEMKKRLAGMDVKVIESGEAASPRAGRRELWPYILGFLLFVLAVETGVAGRV
ncbi:MAG TPA: BatA and WFA domain-containing protein [Thermodesulfobacteriota bacterium]|nr:BatA and WFA domain-containing protein [Thermodesulfobacteriota bacterium]